MEGLLTSRNLQYLSWSLCWDTLPGMFSQSPLTHHSGYDLIRTFTTPTKCKPRLDSVFVQFMTFFSRPKQFLTCYKSPRPAGSVFRSKEHTGKQPLEWGLQAWLPSIPAPHLTLGSTKRYHLKALHWVATDLRCSWGSNHVPPWCLWDSVERCLCVVWACVLRVWLWWVPSHPDLGTATQLWGWRAVTGLGVHGKWWTMWCCCHGLWQKTGAKMLLLGIRERVFGNLTSF